MFLKILYVFIVIVVPFFLYAADEQNLEELKKSSFPLIIVLSNTNYDFHENKGINLYGDGSVCISKEKVNGVFRIRKRGESIEYIYEGPRDDIYLTLFTDGQMKTHRLSHKYGSYHIDNKKIPLSVQCMTINFYQHDDKDYSSKYPEYEISFQNTPTSLKFKAAKIVFIEKVDKSSLPKDIKDYMESESLYLEGYD